MKIKTLLLIACVLIAVVAIPVAASDTNIPDLPVQFYGTLYNETGEPAPAGTVLIASVNGVTSTYTLTEAGKIGGSETFDEKMLISGLTDGDTIIFSIQGGTDSVTYHYTETSGDAVVELILYIPPLVQDEHIHDGIEWTAWSSTTSLPDIGGCYYLTDDVTLSYTWELSDKVELCLNGHVIRMESNTKDVAKVLPMGTLRIHDCGNTAHYFTVNQTSGLWEPSETQTSETKVVTGGIITGGKNGIWVLGGTLELYGGNIIGNAGSGLYVYDSDSVTMVNGTIAGNAGANYGGGVYLSNSHLTMNGGAISDNTIVFRGGGVLVSEESTFTMTGGVIAGNTAPENGGGIAVERNSTMMMTGGSIAENVVTYYVEADGSVRGGSGGGIFISRNSTVIMDGGDISGNTAAFGGGINVGDESTFTMDDGRITENSAYLGGGVTGYGLITMNGGVIEANTAKYYAGLDVQDGTVIINDGSILRNTAESGTGVCIYNGTLTINGGTIADNAATNGTAGGIYAYKSAVTMAGGSVSGNTASKTGSGLYVYNSSVTLSGSATVNADNEAYFNPYSTITVTGDTFTGGLKNITSSSSVIADGQIVIRINSNTLTASSIQNQFGLHSKHSGFTLSPTTDNKALAVTSSPGAVTPTPTPTPTEPVTPSLTPTKDSRKNVSAVTAAEVVYTVTPAQLAELTTPVLEHGSVSLVMTEKVVVTNVTGTEIPASVDTDGTITLTCSVSKNDVLTVTFLGRVLGDVTGDGEASTIDAARILQASANIVTLDDVAAFYGDVNADGKATTLDAARILQYSAKLVDENYEVLS